MSRSAREKLLIDLNGDAALNLAFGSGFGKCPPNPQDIDRIGKRVVIDQLRAVLAEPNAVVD